MKWVCTYNAQLLCLKFIGLFKVISCVQKSNSYSRVFWLSLYPFSESEKQVSFLEPEASLIHCKIWLNHIDIVQPLLFSWIRLTRGMVELCLHCLVFRFKTCSSNVFPGVYIIFILLESCMLQLTEMHFLLSTYLYLHQCIKILWATN